MIIECPCCYNQIEVNEAKTIENPIAKNGNADSQKQNAIMQPQAQNKSMTQNLSNKKPLQVQAPANNADAWTVFLKWSSANLSQNTSSIISLLPVKQGRGEIIIMAKVDDFIIKIINKFFEAKNCKVTIDEKGMSQNKVIAQ